MNHTIVWAVAKTIKNKEIFVVVLQSEPEQIHTYM